MVAGHIGLQVTSKTKRAFFRPRAALGIGIYGFSTETSWYEDLPDTSIKLAHENLDNQTSFGWRGLIGADFFIMPQWGATIDFVYDHVFELNQNEGLLGKADRTSRFHGFTVGIIYMFKTKD
jgi:opacity protein-like surface antigen